uniref:PCI domain-containing protein n=1 Tax=Macrostomum lignano TaxID=282301 RepID=A0A1I8FJZ4_9PLAT
LNLKLALAGGAQAEDAKQQQQQQQQQVANVAPSVREAAAACKVSPLQNLFRILPENSPLRYTVYLALTLWRRLHSALTRSGDTASANACLIDLMDAYTEQERIQSQRRSHYVHHDSVYIMDHLLSLKPIQFLEGELIHELLMIFVSGSLTDYLTFADKNADFVRGLNICAESCMNKLRLLTLMRLAENKLELDYALLQDELKMESDDLEEFIIDGGGILQKLDEVQRKVGLRHHPPTFGRAQWTSLRHTLQQWHDNLQEVQTKLQVLAPREGFSSVLIKATMSMPSRNNDNDSNNTEQSLSMVSAPGLEEAMRRKERLQRLRQRQLNPESAATVESVDTPAGIPVAHLFCQCFRNYKAETDHLAAGHLPAPDLVDVESRLGDQLKAAEPKPLLTADSDITAIAPKKPGLGFEARRGTEAG